MVAGLFRDRNLVAGLPLAFTVGIVMLATLVPLLRRPPWVGTTS